MAISLPWTRRWQRLRLPDPRRLADRIRLPDLPNPSSLSGRIDLPDMPDLTSLPQRLRAAGRRPRAEAVNWPRRGMAAMLLILSAGVGAAAAYFLDPERGRGRRIQAVNQISGLGRRTGRHVERWTRYTIATVNAVGQRMRNRPAGEEPANDARLAQQVESELFRDASIAGRMGVNVENGVVMADTNGQPSDEFVPSNQQP